MIRKESPIRVGGRHAQLPKLPQIPRHRYTDKTFYDLEQKYVFKRTWLLVSHASEFEQAGSYRLLDVPIAPIVLVKGEDGEIRAFINACRHRGAAVVREESGCARTLTCPYHSWTYDLTGKLKSLPAKSSFTDLDTSELSLQSVRCELWGGFIFINLDEKAKPLSDWMQPMTSRYSVEAQAPFKMIDKQTYQLDCNWKILVEAFRETYHVPTIHPQTAASVFDGYESFFEVYPNGAGAMFMQCKQSRLDGEWAGAPMSELPLIPGFAEQQFAEIVAPSFFPNVTMPFQIAGFPVLTMWPLAVNRSRLDVTWFGMDWGDGPRPQEWDNVMTNHDYLAQEDFSNLRSIQAAIEADPNKDVLLSTQECLLYQLHAEIDRAIGVENLPERLRLSNVSLLDDFIIDE